MRLQSWFGLMCEDPEDPEQVHSGPLGFLYRALCPPVSPGFVTSSLIVVVVAELIGFAAWGVSALRSVDRNIGALVLIIPIFVAIDFAMAAFLAHLHRFGPLPDRLPDNPFTRFQRKLYPSWSWKLTNWNERATLTLFVIGPPLFFMGMAILALDVSFS